ncbi:DUF2924 domain-containing protein [Microvirga sp. SYSU G3D207]|uniref:DUF2924 domain-containing protein n=2 Tax=Microvirga arsenatis TaxID=2692265 RepID=A0ABW9YVH2_9HYPH|nr:DUF2924 domain-containing protein [Microvirga arsenatis]NBJ24155.1 DUF2924 domain-containing protein [Microvirga arsenatis]
MHQGAAEAASFLTTNLQAELDRLDSLDLHELRIRWRRLYRSPAPAHLNRPLLVRMIAYKMQTNVFGDLDRETIRFLERIARQRKGGKPATRTVPAVPEKKTLKPGTVLVREHGGILHQVVVSDTGFRWNGAHFKSLSEVARAITGTSWNGPRFFGLRDKTASGPNREEHP